MIISEWMGYFLLYESMLNSVVIARDRFLVLWLVFVDGRRKVVLFCRIRRRCMLRLLRMVSIRVISLSVWGFWFVDFSLG